MSEDTSQSPEEKPRYLLPDGCKDLLGVVWPPEEPPKKAIHFLDPGPPWPELIAAISKVYAMPSCLAGLPDSVSRLLTSPYSVGSLLIVNETQDHQALALIRQGDQTRLRLAVFEHDPPGLEQSIRALFARDGTDPFQDPATGGDDSMRMLDYLLPQSADAITAICRVLLTECFEVQPGDSLRFTLSKGF